MCRQTFCWWSFHVINFFYGLSTRKRIFSGSEPDHNGSRVYSDQEILTTSEFQRIKHQHVCYYLNIFFPLIFFWYYPIITKYHHYCRFPQMLCNRVLAVCFSDFLISSLNRAFNPSAFLFSSLLFLSFSDLYYLIMYIQQTYEVHVCSEYSRCIQLVYKIGIYQDIVKEWNHIADLSSQLGWLCRVFSAGGKIIVL